MCEYIYEKILFQKHNNFFPSVSLLRRTPKLIAFVYNMFKRKVTFLFLKFTDKYNKQYVCLGGLGADILHLTLSLIVLHNAYLYLSFMTILITEINGSLHVQLKIPVLWASIFPAAREQGTLGKAFPQPLMPKVQFSEEKDQELTTDWKTLFPQHS